jgi:type III pantothenate kinase
MALIQWSKHQFGIAPQFARSTFTAANVSSAYDVPERLGVDRWLAMLAAYNSLSEAVVVIDLGSAMTADGISKAGHHVGGYIAPGLRMMAQSLLARTDLVRFDGEHSFCSIKRRAGSFGRFCRASLVPPQ